MIDRILSDIQADLKNVWICRIGVVSGKAIFGPPLDEYWKKKQQEEAVAKETDASSK